MRWALPCSRCIGEQRRLHRSHLGSVAGPWAGGRGQWQGWDHALGETYFPAPQSRGYEKDKHRIRQTSLFLGCFFKRVGSCQGLPCTRELSHMVQKRLWGMPPSGASVTTVSNLMPEGPLSWDTLRKTNKIEGRLLMNCLKGMKRIANEGVNVSWQICKRVKEVLADQK